MRMYPLLRACVFFALSSALAGCLQSAPTPSENTPKAPNELLSAQATGSWQKIGGALDNSSAKNAISPQLALDRKGQLYAAWVEDNRVYMEQWQGTAWRSISKSSPLVVSNSFRLVFDNDNNPVVAGNTKGSYDIKNETSVYRFDLAKQTWEKLGPSFEGTPNIATDKNGNLYSVRYSDFSETDRSKGINYIRRWDGKVWQRYASYQNLDAGFDSEYSARVFDIGFKSDGTTLTLSTSIYRAYISEQWNGSSWLPLCAGSIYYGTPKLDRKDQCFYSDDTRTVYQGNTVLSDYYTVDASSTVFDTGNRPIVLDYYNSSDIRVDRWESFENWVGLGSTLDRSTTQTAREGSLVINNQNTLYAAWQECVFADAITGECSNWNVYVSKFVP
ncbi:MAG: hypothetical protein ACRCYY_14105 [Trueperaceae bacterium]